MRLSWDIFCTVIDNYGDIGICWRLARQLAQERKEPVRLWVDDLAAFARLNPAIDGSATQQHCDGVEIRHWCSPWVAVAPHAVVIEAFACNPPEAFLAAMAASQPKPVWINLDYLSAEDWVEGCHRLGSRHPRLPLTHYFFFPGFTPATGGLLREAGLLTQRAAFDQVEFLQGLGISPPQPAQPLVSLFCYDNPALPAMLQHWRLNQELTLLVADGKPRQQVEAWLERPFTVGSSIRQGRLLLHALPFLPQPDYDKLLWACDWNFVRGEDSFVRAQWAGQPLVWHIYPQDDAAHMVKLEAFMHRYSETLAAPAADSLRAFWRAWNHGDGKACSAAWPALAAHGPALRQQALRWCAQQTERPDLMQQLAAFATEKSTLPQ
ncbi:elongation factor P maturation arginine rhamnosyltransferase EarP [Chitinimonas viridis]|uniref:Protein-arginine rhamnosyltransferase n=1 Tax=Chitinimonas viridis TaxID=664880 RepID=A0ABT8B6D8_9NEIS|nr:elongation factor P maturation arginine rhamnosyltransferase EarP [Chitinimonas viridis]MDN3577310.1 elongation factor P maturation arginine rhamnosyltransferase EarP [Chitinimonas viridis]